MPHPQFSLRSLLVAMLVVALGSWAATADPLFGFLVAYYAGIGALLIAGPQRRRIE